MQDNSKKSKQVLDQQENQQEKNIYRFNGLRYSLRGTDHHGPDEIIPIEKSLLTFPKKD